MQYIIGVDAGGTKTSCEAYSLGGKLLSSATSSFGSVVVDKKEALRNIKTGIDECMSSLTASECKGIVVGAAGAETGNALEEIKSYLIKYYDTKVIVTNDAKLAMYGYLEGKDGILLISGTGSIGYGKKGNTIERCGGWGHLIDDKGSGYYIAMEAIRRIVKERDERREFSNLSKKILKHININEIKYLIDFVYNSPKGQIASIVPVILDEAENNDKTAIDILVRAGQHLFDIIKTLCNSMNFNNDYITFSGSIMKIPLVKNTIIHRMKNELPNLKLLEKQCSPTIGGYYIFIEESSI
ncbi:N-acetylglucosamine kinase [Vallitalea maricola]|uniref:BadF/BadG/BcrA/BcrD ATPase family protein n=1 Tax=Vallitalea maricola TaxID=3074433 RepID=A0ACB5UD99_9FIRM|nr:BadF/BadG/BcrA/BcrD ATPase family protein [Vallitalea sp. AN17-2]